MFSSTGYLLVVSYPHACMFFNFCLVFFIFFLLFFFVVSRTRVVSLFFILERPFPKSVAYLYNLTVLARSKVPAACPFCALNKLQIDGRAFVNITFCSNELGCPLIHLTLINFPNPTLSPFCLSLSLSVSLLLAEDTTAGAGVLRLCQPVNKRT